MEASVIKYAKHFPVLTKELYEEHQDVYDAILIQVRLDELQDNYSKVKKINKPNSKGTQITFVAIEKKEDAEGELDKILAEGKKLGLKFFCMNKSKEELLCSGN